MEGRIMSRHALRSSIKHADQQAGHRVLIVIGDGAEVLDTMGPYYRLGEEYTVVVAAPEAESYHLVIHELGPGWDITVEREGYRIESDIAFRDVDPDDYAALVLPGGRAPNTCDTTSTCSRSRARSSPRTSRSRRSASPGCRR